MNIHTPHAHKHSHTHHIHAHTCTHYAHPNTNMHTPHIDYPHTCTHILTHPEKGGWCKWANPKETCSSTAIKSFVSDSGISISHQRNSNRQISREKSELPHSSQSIMLKIGALSVLKPPCFPRCLPRLDQGLESSYSHLYPRSQAKQLYLASRDTPWQPMHLCHKLTALGCSATRSLYRPVPEGHLERPWHGQEMMPASRCAIWGQHPSRSIHQMVWMMLCFSKCLSSILKGWIFTASKFSQKTEPRDKHTLHARARKDSSPIVIWRDSSLTPGEAHWHWATISHLLRWEKSLHIPTHTIYTEIKLRGLARWLSG
jgi:hypothetical protein